VFVYGTLMYDEVSTRVVSGRYRRAPATLPGYRRCKVRGEEYPAIIADSAAAVDGIVWFDVSPNDLARLDTYEAQEYERIEMIEAGAASASTCTGSGTVILTCWTGRSGILSISNGRACSGLRLDALGLMRMTTKSRAARRSDRPVRGRARLLASTTTSGATLADD
jgi:gamma-glutamylcyclotransferase (GGCT)/AIG2-like uncharacterized protein YtfP